MRTRRLAVVLSHIQLIPTQRQLYGVLLPPHTRISSTLGSGARLTSNHAATPDVCVLKPLAKDPVWRLDIRRATTERPHPLPPLHVQTRHPASGLLLVIPLTSSQHPAPTPPLPGACSGRPQLPHTPPSALACAQTSRTSRCSPQTSCGGSLPHTCTPRPIPHLHRVAQSTCRPGQPAWGVWRHIWWSVPPVQV
jgi:hypothetical protein